MKKISLYITSLAMTFLFSAEKAYAILGSDSPSDRLFISFGSNDPKVVVMNFINILLVISGTVAMLFLIVGGMFYIMSGANEDLAKRGKMYVKNSIIGLIIIILSYTIISVVYRELTS